MLHLFYYGSELWNHILKGLNKNIPQTEVLLNLNLFIRVCRKILGRKIIYFPFLRNYIFLPNVYKSLSLVKPNESLIVIDRILIAELWAIAKSVPSETSLFLWFWNPLSKTYKENEIKSNISLIKTLGYKIYTFDEIDAKRYSLNLNTQVFSYPQKITNREIKWDFYFLGRIKDRKSEIDYLLQILNTKGYKCLFKYVRNSKDVISYQENIINIESSICIVDIVQKKQSGLTLRPLEALFYKKKLITNFKDIKKYDFYNPNNIFIIGDDDWDKLENFLNEPFKSISLNILRKYEINNWIQMFK